MVVTSDDDKIMVEYVFLLPLSIAPRSKFRRGNTTAGYADICASS